MYDIVIVGSGPAGLTAALYARRAEKSVLIIEKNSFGGQITHSPRVENYPGFHALSGNEMAEKMLDQVMMHGAEIELDTVTKIEGTPGNYTVITKGGEFSSKSVIIATGSRHRTLGLPGEELYTGEGISYCAVCDGAFYKGKTVAVIGGGNTALQEAVLLSDGCQKVYIIQNLDFLTGEESLKKKLSETSNVEIICGNTVSRIIGDDTFRGIVIKDTETGEEREMLIDGIFVAIGQKPENEAFADVTALNEYGYIKAGEDCIPEGAPLGIFTAGDCRTKSVRQVTTATADGAVAALAACRFIDADTVRVK